MSASGHPAGPAQQERTPHRTETASGRRAAKIAVPAQPPAGVPAPRSRPESVGLTLLVVGDDPTDAFTLPDLSDSSGIRIRIRRARNLTEAERLLTDDVNCILLDNQDDDGLESLRHLLRLAPNTAVIAVTGEDDADLGAEAVRVGAQDYLSHRELSTSSLARTIRYAVERKRADVAQRQLTESRLRAQENSRLERGLLPTPLLDGSGLRFAARYRPGRSRALLGGDFYDAVRTPDGAVHAMIGDVCGHGPDEAALGVELRIAWRALTLAGLCGETVLDALQLVLENERPDDEIFATMTMLEIAPDGTRAGLYLAGHPAPLFTCPGNGPRLLPHEAGGPALGLLPDAQWQRYEVNLGPVWSLMLYTDGLIEGRVGEGTGRLGQEGLVEIVAARHTEGLSGEPLLDAAVTEARLLNGGELTDDVAVVLLERG